MEPGEKRNTTEKAMDADRANETIKRDECEMRTWYFKVAVCLFLFISFCGFADRKCSWRAHDNEESGRRASEQEPEAAQKKEKVLWFKIVIMTCPLNSF